MCIYHELSVIVENPAFCGSAASWPIPVPRTAQIRGETALADNNTFLRAEIFALATPLRGVSTTHQSRICQVAAEI
jgi:hypothetical protein